MQLQKEQPKILKIFSVFKKGLYFILLSIFFGCNSNKNIIQYNGVYQSKKVDNYYYYLRFYKNNIVIEVSSTGKPRHLKKWFSKKHNDISIGKFVNKNDSIFFNVKSNTGIVKHKGTFINKRLFLKKLSKINGHKDSLYYSFKKLNFK